MTVGGVAHRFGKSRELDNREMAEAESPSRVGVKRRKIFCEHCEDFVSNSTFYRHRAQFFDLEKREWTKDAVRASESSDSEESIVWPDSEGSQVVTSELEPPADMLDSNAQLNLGDKDSDTSSSEDESSKAHLDEMQRLIVECESSESEQDEDNGAVPLQVHTYLFFFLSIWQFSFRISNAAMSALLRFLKYFVLFLGRAFHCQPLLEVGNAIPLTLVAVHRAISLQEDDFVALVVCPSCNSVYQYDECYEVKTDGKKEPKLCRHVAFPNHPQAYRRKPCGSSLLKKVKVGKKDILRPIKVYPYKSLRKSIEQLAKRKGFIEDCEQWRTRSVPEGYMCDIYDGAVWKKFNSSECFNFLSQPHCYLLTLNVDWFQPYERGVYSVGAIYLTVQNLPRYERNKPENIIIVGIIPGPAEPKGTINSYLTPLVMELMQSWEHGLQVTSYQNTRLCIRLALACVSCDIPATRKVCGFLSHNACLGCNKCLKHFDVRFGEQSDFSGYDRENWTMRTQQQHRQGLNEILKQVTKTAMKSEESKRGIRYSILLALPYFDPIQFTAIDCMHNLFLGTAKHVFQVWVDKELLKKKPLREIESKVKLFHVPADVGRLPSNISSSYGAFTADQWRNWITIYSPVVLKGILSAEHLRCWLLFVRSCSMLCSRCIRHTDVVSADLFLEQFCRKFQELYGPLNCTSNMHLHLHLKQTLLDFGPAHASWCYAFERFNGILGSYHTNNKAIESQIMKKFCQDQSVHRLELPLDNDFLSVLPQNYGRKAPKPIDSLGLLNLARDPLSKISTFAFTDLQSIDPLSPMFEVVLDPGELQRLSKVYLQLYPDQQIAHLPSFYNKCGRILIGGELIGSVMPGPNNKSSAVISAFWPGSGHRINNIDYGRMRVGVVQHFLQHSPTFVVGSEVVKRSHMFAYVRWKQVHQHRDWYGVSATVCVNMFEPESTCCFLPVQRIACRCASLELAVDFGDIAEVVFIACPIALKYAL